LGCSAIDVVVVVVVVVVVSIHHTAHRNILEDSHLHTHSCENLKYQSVLKQILQLKKYGAMI
jgi:hypothetical protein